MSDDVIRQNLVTAFFCFKCSERLNISTVRPKESADCGDNITGAAKVDNKIFLHPCKNCMRPIKDVVAAIETIKNITSINVGYV